MSRYNQRITKDITFTYGYDIQLGTFFFQLEDRRIEDCYDAVIEDEGNIDDQITDISALEARIETVFKKNNLTPYKFEPYEIENLNKRV